MTNRPTEGAKALALDTPQGPGAKSAKRQRRGIQLKPDRPRLDFATVGAAAVNRWPEIHTAMGIDRAHLRDTHGPCPGCGGSDRFRYDDQDGRGTWFCSGGGEPRSGDGFELLTHVHGWPKQETLHQVADYLHLRDDYTAPAAPPAKAAPRPQVDKAATQAQAAIKAKAEWERGQPAPEDHPYLVAKGIPPMGARVDRQNRLLIPITGPDGNLQSLERITPDGQKRFFTDARKAGGWYQVQTGAADSPIAICEGFATACSIAAAMAGWRVLCAFDAGNLTAVASMVRAASPDHAILICGDNDSAKHPGTDPGRAAALRTAAATRAAPLLPPAPGDWNDYSQAKGLDALHEALSKGFDDVLAHKFDESVSVLSNQQDRLSKDSRQCLVGISQGALLYETEKGDSRSLIDSAAAEIIADALRGRLAYDSEAASWLLWSVTHWQPLTSAAQADKLIADAVHVGTGHIGFRLGYLTGITSIITRRGLLPPPVWPSNVVPFQNGLLDLDTRELRPATPTHALDWCLPHSYDQAADCPTIKAWLYAAVEQDADTVQLLRAWLAALVRGIPLQVFLVLIGRGGSGKGTFQRLAMALVGALNAAISTLRDLEENRFETAKLYGKRLCMVNEAGRHGGSLNMLKAITGGDHLPLERKHVQQSGTFRFDGLVLMASNEQIMSSDATSGLERRRVTVRFPRSATPIERADWAARGGEEGVLHTEIPGLIRWLLDMPVAEVRARIETPPARVTADNLLGLAAGNPVADWLMECCIPGESTGGEGDPFCTQIGVKKEIRESGALVYEHADRWLFANYLTWCNATGRKSLSQNRFSAIVVDMAETLGHPVHKAQHPTLRTYHLYGLRLRGQFEPVFDWARPAREAFRETGERLAKGQPIDSIQPRHREANLLFQTSAQLETEIEP